MQEFLYIVIALAIVGLINLALKPRIKKYPSGLTIKEAKDYLENNTHCGKYWGVKAKYDRSKEIVYVHMSGNERVELELKTGIIKRQDFDY